MTRIGFIVVHFSFDLDALTKIDEQADFNAGRFEIVDQLGAVGIVEVFDGFQFEDDFVFNDDVGQVVADQLVVAIDLNIFIQELYECGTLLPSDFI